MSSVFSQDINLKNILKITIPTMCMMFFMSLYTIVDGIFVARLVGDDALAGLNIVYPFIGLSYAVSIMLGTGGSAIIAREMGRGRYVKARRIFSLLLVVGLFAGLIFTLVGMVFTDQIITILGGTEELYEYCYDYLWVLSIFVPAAIFQALFQVFFATAGKPGLALFSTLVAGLANVVLDYVFIAELSMGISGAAYATGISQAFSALFGLIYFFFWRKQTLFIIRPKFYISALKEACYNGSSEMVTNLSISLTTVLFNYLMLQYIGKAGVSAIAIILYAQFFQIAIFLGFSIGIGPLFSFNFGKKDFVALKKLFKLSIWFILWSSITTFGLAFVLVDIIVEVFAKEGSEVFKIAHEGFLLYSIAYLFMGINVFASGLFTALSNGKVSAIISFMRTLVFILISMATLPKLIGVPGIWLAVPLAEFLTIFVSIFFIFRMNKVYKYF